MKEQVLVVDEGRMEGFKSLPGLSTNVEDIGRFLTDVIPYAKFIDREEAEKNTEFKQVIPYCIVKHKNKFLVYKRTKKGGEGRLHEKFSIGIGGHVNPIDGETDPMLAFVNSFVREVNEELDFIEELNPYNFSIKEIGLIYDPSNDVGRVHLGYAFCMILDDFVTELPTVAEDALSELQWLTKDEIRKLNNLENWSELALKGI